MMYERVIQPKTSGEWCVYEEGIWDTLQYLIKIGRIPKCELEGKLSVVHAIRQEKEFPVCAKSSAQ